MASLSSIRAATDRLLAESEPFDAIIANAGVMACPFGKTSDGFEMQFGTNHLGRFALVNQLAWLLEPGSRFVNLSSAGHRRSDVDLDDPNFERTPYTAFGAYGRSKSAAILFAVEFDRRHRHRGIRACAVHPGTVKTELGRHITPELMQVLVDPRTGGGALTYKSLAQGAATTVWCAAVAPSNDIGGRYCEDCQVAEISVDSDSRRGVRAYAMDPSRARSLWQLSEELIGQHFEGGPAEARMPVSRQWFPLLTVGRGFGSREISTVRARFAGR